MKNSIVIVGTGLAGYSLAREFRKQDPGTPLIMLTADDGVFCSKPSLSTALTLKKTASDLALYSAEQMAHELKATIYTHSRVTTLNPNDQTITTAQGMEIPYHQLVLACGSEVRRPVLSGDATTDIQSVNDLTAYTHFRQWLSGKKHLLILGTGLVGCEFANDLLNAGYQLDMLSPDPYPLARLVPEPIGRAVETAFAAQGVRWHLNTSALAVNRSATGYDITSDPEKPLHGDGVFSAIGIRASCDLALSAHLEINRGIVVDRYLRTTRYANIFALGDCTEVAGEIRQYVPALLHAARALAQTLTGKLTPVFYPPMPVAPKTPCCPVVVLPPPRDINGDWEYTGTGPNQRALFYDAQRQLRGFALAGHYTSEKLSLSQQLSSIRESSIVGS